ncbi:MAG TPA: nucleotide exchange factor GrpE [Pedococcus sp.]|nr:nucleotide exchange factor GrpE [Pedococcus sp.]
MTEHYAAGQNPTASDPEVVVGEEASEPTPAAAGTESGVTDPDVIELEALEAEVADQQDADVVTTSDDAALAAERLADLQRLQAEYVNYKRRVDRDRALVQERAAQSVIEALLPVLDDIHAAREHGDLTDGPFAAIADKLEGVLGKFGLERYGAVGEDFDPMVHEALMHTSWPQDGSVISTGSTAVVQVLQPGYRAGEQVLRAARVAVADPE